MSSNILPVRPQFPKRCHCGHVFVAAPEGLASNGGIGTFVWRDLSRKGDQADEFERYEMRDCLCGSTLMILVERYKEDPDEAMFHSRETPKFGVPRV